jgi:hypothetical protein
VLVGLNALDCAPTYYVLPRNHVAVLIYMHNRWWLTKSAKNGKPHQQTSRRNIAAKNIADGVDAWNRLHGPTIDVPLSLSKFYRDIFEEGSTLGIRPPCALAIA